MGGINDPSYLRAEQYRDATNLCARIDLHARYSTNLQGWHTWIFEQLRPLAPASVIFELGCGQGKLWADNLARLPHGWRVTLSDFSRGMLTDARRTLVSAPGRFEFLLADARHIPLADGTIDAVIANHMLYHVPNRRQALGEVARVLTRNGSLFASTVGERHLGEIDVRLQRAGVPAAYRGAMASATFTLENGAAQLGEVFADVTLQRYADGLRVTEMEPLMAFVQSMTAATVLAPPALQEIRRDFAAELASKGEVRITKDTGLFVARGKRV
jgi:ubiquinone/menaquinone biosynthesis C-methylase UbiE